MSALQVGSTFVVQNVQEQTEYYFKLIWIKSLMMIFHYQLEVYHKWSTKMLVEQMALLKNGSANR